MISFGRKFKKQTLAARALISVAICLLSPTVSAQTTTNASLSDIIVHAYSHHPQLKSLRAELVGTRELLTESRSQYLPQISLDGNLSSSNRNATLRNGTSFDQNTTPKSLSLRLDQTLFTGGRRSLSQKGAKLTIDASEARYQSTTTIIAADIIQDYMSLLAATEEVKVLTNSVETLKEFKGSVVARRNVQDSTLIELSQANSRLASAQASLASARSNLQIAQSRLLSKTGFFIAVPQFPAQAKQPITLSLEDAKAIANDVDPALKASKLDEMTASVVARSESRKHYPTISLIANATTVLDSSPTIDRDEDFNIGLRLTMPIYTAGAGSAATRRAIANLNAARYNYVNTVREADLRIAQLWSQLQNSYQVIEAQQASVAASKEALKGVKRAKEAGLSDTRDILEAEQNRLNAELALLRAQYQQYTARLLLHLYLGNLDVYGFD